MSNLYDYYNTNDDSNSFEMYGVYWCCQTFTASSNYFISSVKLKLFRTGNPTTLYVGIKATNVDGKPTGDFLTIGSIPCSSIALGSPGAWYEIVFDPSLSLTSGIKYAIVGYITGGAATHKITWRSDFSSPTYTNGQTWFSSNSGSSWTSYPTADLMFETWGSPLTVDLSSTGSFGLTSSGSLFLSKALCSGSTSVDFTGIAHLRVPIVHIKGTGSIVFTPIGHLILFKFFSGAGTISIDATGDMVIVIGLSGGSTTIWLSAVGLLHTLYEYFTPTGGRIKFGVWKAETPTVRLNRDDLKVEDNNPPVNISKRSPNDTFNRITVKWTDVDKESGFSIVTANDEIDQRDTGIVRKRNYDLLGLTTAEQATKMAYRLLAEAIYRYTVYKFTLSYRNMLLDVGDVVSLSDGFNITDQAIRLTKIAESKDGSKLEVEAIEDKEYFYMIPGQRYSDNKHTRPTPPTLTEPNVYFTESIAEPVINLHLCPQDEYFNGFVIFYSFDDVTYGYAGRCNADTLTCNLDGLLLSSLPEWPAIMHTKEEIVHLAQNATFANLQSVSDTEFFNNLSLLKIEDEVIAFQNVSGTPSDFLVSNLIRGLFNTAATTHAIGTIWNTLKRDFEFEYNQEDIGKTIYFKILTIYGDTMIQLTDATPISYTIKGTYRKSCPASITRLVGREGLQTYMTDDVDVRINLGSREQGFNIGGFDVALYGTYSRDPQIITVETKVWDQAHTVLTYSTVDTIDLSTVAEFTKVITNAMKGGYDPVIVSLTPGGLVKADEKEILIDRV